jgi:hypothetical protein
MLMKRWRLARRKGMVAGRGLTNRQLRRTTRRSLNHNCYLRPIPHRPRAKIERVDSATGERRIEYQAKRSFIHDLSMQPQRVLRMIGKNGDVIFGPPFDRMPNAR